MRRWLAILAVFLIFAGLAHATSVIKPEDVSIIHDEYAETIKTLEKVQVVTLHNWQQNIKYSPSTIAETLKKNLQTGSSYSKPVGKDMNYMEILEEIAVNGKYGNILKSGMSYQAALIVLLQVPEIILPDLNAMIRQYPSLKTPMGGHAEYVVFGEYGTYVIGKDSYRSSIGVFGIVNEDKNDDGMAEVLEVLSFLKKDADDGDSNAREADGNVKSFCDLEELEGVERLDVAISYATKEGGNEHTTQMNYYDYYGKIMEIAYALNLNEDRIDAHPGSVITNAGYSDVNGELSDIPCPAEQNTAKVVWILTDSEEILRKIKMRENYDFPGASIVEWNKAVFLLQKCGEEKSKMGILSLDENTINNKIAKVLKDVAEGCTGSDVRPTEEKEQPEESTITDVLAEYGAQLPEEEYVAVPVDGNAPVWFEGNKYEPICSSGFCVVLLPKDLVAGKILKQEGDRIIALSPTGITTELSEEGISVYDLNHVTLVRRAVLGKEYKIVEYIAKGYVPVSVDVQIPKEGNESPEIVGDYVFLEVDPILRIHLNAYGGNIAVEQVMLEKDARVMEDRIRFASCSLHIEDVTVAIAKEGGYKAYVGFRIYDGDDPVYVPRVSVKVGGESVAPQYDPRVKAYFASSQIAPGTQRISISASAEGCPNAAFVKEIYVGRNSNQILAIIIALLVAVIVAYVLLKFVVWG